MFVYLVRNKQNGKIYIGKTHLTLARRWNIHCLNAKKGLCTYFYSALRKYGPSAFELELLSSSATSPEELNEQERFYIAVYRSSEREFGYNLTKGGDGMVPNEQTRKKMSDARKRNGSSPMKGRHHSATTKAKLSRATQEQFAAGWNPSRMSGLTHSKATKQRMAKAQLMAHAKAEVKKRHSDGAKRMWARKRGLCPSS